MEFRETQKFNQWWIWSILAISLYLTYNSLLAFISIVTVMFFFGYFRLKTTVNNEGIHVNFHPFGYKKTMEWNEIQLCYIREYSPIFEYGGWGWRYSFSSGRAYNVSGNIGLQIVLKNGKRILVGTQNADELKAYIEGLGHYKTD